MTGGPLKPIQVIPPGLTGLLQLKQTGRLPDQLSDTVVPIIELRDWYLTARRLDTQALFGGTPQSATITTGQLGNKQFGAGALGNAGVPENQIWYVEQMTVDAEPHGAVVATDLLRWAPGILPSSGAQLLVGPDVSDYQLAARTRFTRGRAERGFWAFPGDTFIVEIFDNVTTNGWDFFLTLRATPCQL